MATRPRQSEPRLNEYFIDGNGIDREVIQSDICRYLGNDALVRPGNHEGRQGFFIRGYRNLTSTMIEDLKADSARWEDEKKRRAARGVGQESYRAASYPDQRMDYSNTPYQDPNYRQPQGGYPPQQGSPGPYGSYNQPPEYPPTQAYSSAPQMGYSHAPSHPQATAGEMPQGSYAYTSGNNYPYPERAGAAAPRFPQASPYEREHPDYQTGPASGMHYPPTSGAERVTPMESGYPPEAYRGPQGGPPRDPRRPR